MDIALILSKRYPDTQWTLNGDSYSGLTWLSEDVAKPTLEDLQAEWADVQNEAETARIQSLRKAAYTDESDPIFFDYQRGEATEQNWLDAVQAIKDRYPYPVVEGES